MCTVRPLTLAMERDRMPGGSVPLPWGGRFAMSVPTVAAPVEPCASANPLAATEAVATKSRRDRSSARLAVFSVTEFAFASPGIWASPFHAANAKVVALELITTPMATEISDRLVPDRGRPMATGPHARRVTKAGRPPGSQIKGLNEA